MTDIRDESLREALRADVTAVPMAGRRDVLRALGAAAALAGMGGLLSACGVPTAALVLPAERPALALQPDAGWTAKHDMTAAQYQGEFDRLARDGFRPVDVCGYADAGREFYAAIWEKTGGPALVARHGLTPDAYQAEFDRLAEDGYRPVRISAFGIGGQARFAAIWHKVGGPALVARHGLTADAFQAEWDRLAGDGHRPVEVCGYEEGGQARFAGIWLKTGGPALVARHNLTPAAYQAEFERVTKDGYRPVRISPYAVGIDVRYAAIWEQTGGAPFIARHGLVSGQYQSEFTKATDQGFRPVHVRAAGGAVKPVFAGVWEKRRFSPNELTAMSDVVAAFMKTWSVPGMQVAITREGRLVYSEGFGLADTSNGSRVTPASLFRIASISKPITAVTCMRLIEAGRLRLTDTVFGAGGLLGTTYGTQPYGADVETITVQHLLEHTSGWNNVPDDPMFQNPDFDHAALISAMLDDRPLATTPGREYEYLNFGYCLLGRVIERVTGKPYATAVQELVLAPCGITAMQPAGNTLADRRTGEVVYYGQGGETPYTWRVDRMDAHGGWLATASDLMRFVTRVDGFGTRPDILNPASITTMTTASTANPVPAAGGSGYAKGWLVHSEKNWFHDGSLPGTATLLVRRNDGFNWAALANTRDPVANGKIIGAMDRMLIELKGKVGTWPTYDLF
ncbi:serine hydrolase [Actinomycetes bacterium KLBMP 9759]